jgi:hypothetical protein
MGRRNASRHVNPKQLRMFIPAGELRQMGISPYDAQHSETGQQRPHDAVWEEKIDEASRSGLEESIRSTGVHTPVNIYHLGENEDPTVVLDYDAETGRDVTGSLSPTTIAHGHHRVASAALVDPSMLIPVQNFDRTSTEGGKVHPFLNAVTEGQEEPKSR